MFPFLFFPFLSFPFVCFPHSTHHISLSLSLSLSFAFSFLPFFFACCYPFLVSRWTLSPVSQTECLRSPRIVLLPPPLLQASTLQHQGEISRLCVKTRTNRNEYTQNKNTTTNTNTPPRQSRLIDLDGETNPDQTRIARNERRRSAFVLSRDFAGEYGNGRALTSATIYGSFVLGAAVSSLCSDRVGRR